MTKHSNIEITGTIILENLYKQSIFSVNLKASFRIYLLMFCRLTVQSVKVRYIPESSAPDMDH